MTYADERRIIDVDSHLFELDDFLHAVATPEEAAYLNPMDQQTELPVSLDAIERGREYLDRRNSDPDVMAKFEATMFDIGRSPWSRLGAFDPADRSHALDLLGFERQIVLGTFSFHQIAHVADPKGLEVGARVHNRAMGRFCANDERLLAGGYVPLSLGPQVAGDLLDEAFADGCHTVMVDTNEADPSAKSFTHPDFDPVWARFAERDVPVIVHIAVNGHYDPVSPSFSTERRGCRGWLHKLDFVERSSSLISWAPTCSASRLTIPIPKVRLTRSASSKKQWMGWTRPPSKRSTPATSSASSGRYQVIGLSSLRLVRVFSRETGWSNATRRIGRVAAQHSWVPA